MKDSETVLVPPTPGVLLFPRTSYVSGAGGPGVGTAEETVLRSDLGEGPTEGTPDRARSDPPVGDSGRVLSRRDRRGVPVGTRQGSGTLPPLGGRQGLRSTSRRPTILGPPPPSAHWSAS